MVCGPRREGGLCPREGGWCVAQGCGTPSSLLGTKLPVLLCGWNVCHQLILSLPVTLRRSRQALEIRWPCFFNIYPTLCLALSSPSSSTGSWPSSWQPCYLSLQLWLRPSQRCTMASLLPSLLFPPLSPSLPSSIQIISSFSVREQTAYASAAAIAEQAISSIRTVVSFGGEQKEAAQ